MNRLKECRLAKGLTQVEVSKLIGVTQSTLSNYESGNHECDYKTLRKLAALYDTTVDYLVGRPIGGITDIDEDAYKGMDINELLDSLANREEMRVLFSLTKDATKEDILRTIKIIEALKEKSDL